MCLLRLLRRKLYIDNWGEQDVREVSHDIVYFLKIFSSIVHRWRAITKDFSIDDLKEKNILFDIIAKPVDVTRGMESLIS